MEANKCGSCTMCCKLMGIPELAKPVDKWCSHCEIGTGCSIYSSRPGSCVEFACAWLQGQDEKLKPSVEFRPDKLKVMLFCPIEDPTNVIAVVDPKIPNAWKSAFAMTFMARLAATNHRVVVRARERYYQIFPDESYREIEMSPADSNGKQTFVRYKD